MAEHKEVKKIMYGMMGSTEAAARGALHEIRESQRRGKPEEANDPGDRRTAKDTHKRMNKKQGKTSLAKARKSQSERKTTPKKSTPKVKKKHYGRPFKES